MVLVELFRELKFLYSFNPTPTRIGVLWISPLIINILRSVRAAKKQANIPLPWWIHEIHRVNKNNMPKEAYYAVARGRTVGIFKTWDECKAQVDKFTGARFKKFQDTASANEFIAQNKNSISAVIGSTAKAKAKPGGSTSNSSDSISTTAKASFLDIPRPAAPLAVAPGPAWRSGFQNLRQLASTAAKTGTNAGISQQPSRPISTSATNSKRHMKVTEDRVVGIKKLKTDSYNSGVDLSKFKTDEEGYVVVFTDGACTGNGKKSAAAGIGVWFDDNHCLNISEPVKGRRHTNNVAEIQAAERAISQAKQAGIDKLCLKTDSQFTINCMTKWIYGWKQNNWKLKSGDAVKNRDDLEKLLAVSKNMQIKWSYVAGHKGHYGNEQADRLAVRGAHS